MVKSEDKVKQLLREFIKLLEDNIRLYAVVLFGSYAEGTPGEFSDIDIAVFSEDFGKAPLDDMKKLFKLRRKVDTDYDSIDAFLSCLFWSSSTLGIFLRDRYSCQTIHP